MKLTKILSLILALVMCASALASLSIFAGNEPEGKQSASTVEFIHAENFDNMHIAKPMPSTTAGIMPINGYGPKAKVENGVFNMTNASTDTTRQAMLDFQLWETDITAISESFTLSLSFKLLGEWTDSLPDFWSFRNHVSKEDFNINTYFTIVGGKFTMATDDGPATSDADIFTDFVTVDWAFTKGETTFTSLSCYVNGVLLGTKTLSDENLTMIDQFRIFYTTTKDLGVALNSFAFAKGAQTLYGVTIPDSEPVYLAAPVPSAPTVADSEKVAMKYHFAENFDGIDQLNISNIAEDVKKASGLWLNTENKQPNNTHTKYTLTEDGTLSWNGAKFLDFHFWQISKYRVKEDFMISVKFKPTSENISGRLIGDIRENSKDDYYRLGVNLSNGCLVVGDDNYGLLPLNEWTFIEVAFHYDENAGDGGLFTSFSIVVNGNKSDKSYELPIAQDFTQIKQFRLFDAIDGQFEIDDLCVISGSTSMLYANAPVPRTAKVATEEEDEDDSSEDDSSGSFAADNAVNEYAPPALKPKAETEAEEEEKGCGSSISVGAIALISAIGVAGVAVIRKKKD